MGVKSAVNGPDSSQVLQTTSTPKYHAADKHDTPPSHFIVTLDKPARLYPVNGEH